MWKLGAFDLKIDTFPRLHSVASYPCRIGTLSHLATMMVQWLACDISHRKRSLISSALQLKRLAWVQWLSLKQCNSQLVSFLQIRDILIGLQAQSQSNFFIIATSIIIFIIIVLIAIQLSNLIIRFYRQCSNLSS